MSKQQGKILLIGTGPGDPGLLTVRGREVLERADVIVYDYQVNPALLRYAKSTAEFVTASGPDANLLMIKQARAGKTVAHLVNDDPFAFNDGVRAANALQTAGVAFEIVPGVIEAVAATAYAGFPLIYADSASSFSFVKLPLNAASDARTVWQNLAKSGGTLAITGTAAQLARSAEWLLADKSFTTPVAIIFEGTTWQQTVVTGILNDVRPMLEEVEPDEAALMAFKIAPPVDFGPMDAAIAELETYAWVIFTSVNGPEFFMQRLHAAHKDARAFAHARICAIGPATAATLEKYNLQADLIPAKFVAESILESFAKAGGVAGVKVLTDEGGPTGTSAAEMRELLEAGEIDVVMFTSSNTVRNFAKRLATVTTKPLNELLEGTVVACIGPITTAAARDEYNLDVTLEASEFTIDRLVETLVKYFDTGN